MHFGGGIDSDMMANQVNQLLEEWLHKSKMNPMSLAAQLVFIKQLVLSSASMVFLSAVIRHRGGVKKPGTKNDLIFMGRTTRSSIAQGELPDPH
jgi:hypothetical protein